MDKSVVVKLISLNGRMSDRFQFGLLRDYTYNQYITVFDDIYILIKVKSLISGDIELTYKQIELHAE